MAVAGMASAKCRVICVGLSCRHPTDEDHPAMAAPKPQGRARKVTQRRNALDPAPGAFSRDDPQNAKDELRKLYGKPRGEKP